MSRINLSLSEKLKAKMDNLPHVNWSAVAVRSFELEVRRNQRIENMEKAQIVDRLKASIEVVENAEFDLGRKEGLDWAAKYADADELMWLDQNRADADNVFWSGQWIDTPFENRNFEDIFSNGERTSLAFVKGFAVGAIELWEKVEDEVRSI